CLRCSAHIERWRYFVEPPSAGHRRRSNPSPHPKNEAARESATNSQAAEGSGLEAIDANKYLGNSKKRYTPAQASHSAAGRHRGGYSAPIWVAPRTRKIAAGNRRC